MHKTIIHLVNILKIFCNEVHAATNWKEGKPVEDKVEIY